MSAPSEYTLYYWNFGCGGRGEYVRLMFEETGTPFQQVEDVDTIRAISQAKAAPGAATNVGFPAFAVPVLKHGDFVLSGTGTICRYLGRKFGLWPRTEEDEWHAEQVNCVIHDFLAEGRLVFHARGFVESYYTQKEETQGHIDWFKKERLHRWLSYFETVLGHNKGGQGYVIGDNLTYVDLALMQVLRASESQFPDEWAANQNTPLLKAFKDRIASRPRLAAYFKSGRCRPFEGNSMM